jgi:predicted DNA-binding protein
MSRTSSFRLTDKLHDRLERFARQQRSRKTSVIVRAIETYLEQHERRILAAEARRQSVLASACNSDEDWLAQADESGWK